MTNDKKVKGPDTTHITLGELLRESLRRLTRIKNGKEYQRVERHEIIKEGAMLSWREESLQPVLNPNTIGKTPSDFSLEREFYNPI